MVDECCAGVPITTNGNTLIDTVRDVGENIVQLVGHTTRLGDVADRALPVELGGNNIVHHTASVSNLEASGLDATDSGRANDCDALLLSLVHDFTSTLQKSVPGRKLIMVSEGLPSPGHPRR